MEACGNSNYWSRKFISYGHEVSQISPQHVKPFVQGNKNDKNDARAIVIAAQQDDMPTVPTKTQQEMQMNHRYRESLVQDRTALANRIRGYLREMGLFLIVGLSQVRKEVPLLLGDATNDLTADMREIISSCHKKVLELDTEIDRYTQKIEQFCKQNETYGRLMQLSGVGPMTASIVYAMVGGKQCLMSISKRGDRYIRSLLIHGGRSVVKGVDKKSDYLSCWAACIMAYDDKYVNRHNVVKKA